MDSQEFVPIFEEFVPIPEQSIPVLYRVEIWEEYTEKKLMELLDVEMPSLTKPTYFATLKKFEGITLYPVAVKVVGTQLEKFGVDKQRFKVVNVYYLSSFQSPEERKSTNNEF